MAKEELEIEIGPDGKVTVRTIGIKGPHCLDVAEAVARIVGQEQSALVAAQRWLLAETRSTSTRPGRPH